MDINKLLNSYFRMTNTIPLNFGILDFSELRQGSLFPDLRNLIVRECGDEDAFREYKVNGTNVKLWASCTQEELDSMVDVRVLKCGMNFMVKTCPEGVEELSCTGSLSSLGRIETTVLRKLNCTDNKLN